MMLLFLILIFPSTYKSNINRLSMGVPLNEIDALAQFLNSNMPQENIYIDEGWNYRYVTLITGIPQTNTSQLNKPEIKNLIKKIGFAETMKKYGIVYLVTTNNTPSYQNYVGLFADESETATLGSLATDRAELAILRSNSEYQPISEIDSGKAQYLVDKYQIVSKFILIKEIGQYKIFTFTN